MGGEREGLGAEVVPRALAKVHERAVEIGLLEGLGEHCACAGVRHVASVTSASGHDHGSARAEGLEEHHSRRFGPARMEQQVGPLKKRGDIVAGPQPANVGSYAKLAR